VVVGAIVSVGVGVVPTVGVIVMVGVGSTVARGVALAAGNAVGVSVGVLVAAAVAVAVGIAVFVALGVAIAVAVAVAVAVAGALVGFATGVVVGVGAEGIVAVDAGSVGIAVPGVAARAVGLTPMVGVGPAGVERALELALTAMRELITPLRANAVGAMRSLASSCWFLLVTSQMMMLTSPIRQMIANNKAARAVSRIVG